MISSYSLIGCGYWGKKILNLLRSKNPKKISIVDHNLECETFLTDKNLELVELSFAINAVKNNIFFVATPEKTHFEIVKKLLEKNKNVFVEKPLCLEKKQAIELIKIAKQSKLKIFVDYIFLFDNAFEEIKKIVKSGNLGKIIQYNSKRHSVNINKLDTTVIDDLAIHDIYLLRELFSNNKDLAIKSFSISPDKKEAKIKANIEKLIISLDYSWRSKKSIRNLEIIGDKGKIVWKKLKNHDELQIYYINENSFELREKHVILNFISPLEKSIDYFLMTNQHRIEKYYSSYIQDISILEKINSYCKI